MWFIHWFEDQKKARKVVCTNHLCTCACMNVMKMNETYLETISSLWSTEIFSGTLVQGWLGRPAASTAAWGGKTALGHSNGPKVGAIYYLYISIIYLSFEFPPLTKGVWCAASHSHWRQFVWMQVGDKDMWHCRFGAWHLGRDIFSTRWRHACYHNCKLHMVARAFPPIVHGVT